MNNNDIINFNGEEITIEDLVNKKPKEILIGLFVKIDKLDEKMKDIPTQVIDNGKSIANMKGKMTIMIPVILTIVGYLVTQHFL